MFVMHETREVRRKDTERKLPSCKDWQGIVFYEFVLRENESKFERISFLLVPENKLTTLFAC